jgi:hypothetical protein
MLLLCVRAQPKPSKRKFRLSERHNNKVISHSLYIAVVIVVARMLIGDDAGDA